MIERILYSKDNFVVAVCSTKEKLPMHVINGIKGEKTDLSYTFNAVGYGIPTHIGQSVYLSGVWQENKKYGNYQMQVQDCSDCVEQTKEAVVAYLSSKIIKGIGRVTAEKIYDRFGDSTLDVLTEHPRRLLEVKGISAKKLNEITRSYSNHMDMHILTRMLAPHGVSYRMIVRIRQTLGESSAALVRENPYLLCRVWGIGFLKADEVALKMGYKPNSEPRIEGGIVFALQSAMSVSGHMFLTRLALVEACAGENGVLNTGVVAKNSERVTEQETYRVIEKMVADGKLVAVKQHKDQMDEYDAIYLKTAYQSEKIAAQRIAQLTSLAKDIKGEELEKARKVWEAISINAEERLGVQLAPEQREGVIMALLYPFSVLTGGPGSGKTTTLSVIAECYQSAFPKDTIALAAPTGRAARRMMQQTGLEASTLHKLLGLKPDVHSDFSMPVSEEDVIEADFLIVDESSMIDASLFAEIMYRMTTKTKLLMIGDVDQLPSVGAGNVLRELLFLERYIPSTRLTKVFRQGENSIIPCNAAKVRVGATNLDYEKGQFSKILCDSEITGAAKIESLVLRLREINRLQDMQILCPMRRRGECCTTKLNDRLRDIVNPPSIKKEEGMIGNTLYRVGDKVMQTRNTAETSNGDIGYIVGFDREEDGRSVAKVYVDFGLSTTPVEFEYEDALELEPAIAMTIHKSQGSEMPIIIVPIFNSMKFFLRRNLFYTAITRAKEHVVIVTDDSGKERYGSLTAAISTEDTSKRNTMLSELIVYSTKSGVGD